jgi:hypothetical protein
VRGEGNGDGKLGDGGLCDGLAYGYVREKGDRMRVRGRWVRFGLWVLLSLW